MRLIDDRTWAVLTIWQEARGCSQDCRVAVAEVIRERMRRKFRSDGTAASTVLWPKQFSGWNARDPNRVKSAVIDDRDPIVHACMQAWDESEVPKLTRGAVYYLATNLRPMPDWADPAKCTTTLSGMAFFTD